MAVLGISNWCTSYVPDGPRSVRLIDGAIQGADAWRDADQRMLAFARRQEL